MKYEIRLAMLFIEQPRTKERKKRRGIFVNSLNPFCFSFYLVVTPQARCLSCFPALLLPLISTMRMAKEARKSRDSASTQLKTLLIQASPPTNEPMVRNLSENGEEPPRFGGFGLRFKPQTRAKVQPCNSVSNCLESPLNRA